MREVMGYGCLFSAIATAACAREVSKNRPFARSACVALAIAIPASCCLILFTLWAGMAIAGVE
jgi:hydroxyethylthiazole kinase-like sugar kinase family protein